MEVTFTKAVTLTDFAYDNGYLKNIKIVSNGEDLLNTFNGASPYFCDPYLKDDGTVLVIPTNKYKDIIPKNVDINYKDIQVTINLRNLNDAEGVPFKMDEYTFSYRVNKSKDEVPPIINSLKIAKTQEDALNGTNLISFEEFSHYAKKANYNNDSKIVAANINEHHVNCVWIYVDANDLDSGVDGIEIREQLIRNVKTPPSSANLVDQPRYDRNTNPQTNMVYNQSKDKSYTDCFKYVFCGDSDGVVHLELVITDKAGNTKSKIVDLIKDTVCAQGVTIKDNSYSDEKHLKINPGPDYHSYTYAIPLYPTYDEGTYCIDLDGNKYEDTFWGKSSGGGSAANPETNVDFSVATMKVIRFEWGYSENDMQEAELQYKDDSQFLYWTNKNYGGNSGWTNQKLHPRITVDPYKTIYTRTTVEDGAGNTLTVNNTIEGCIQIVSASKNYSNNWTFNYNKSLPQVSGKWCIVQKDLSGNETGHTFYDSVPTSLGDPTSSSWPDGITEIYYCNHNGIFDNSDCFWNVTGEPYIITKANGSISYGKNSGRDPSTALPTRNQVSILADDMELSAGTWTVNLTFPDAGSSGVFSPTPGIYYYLDCYCKNNEGPYGDSGTKDVTTELIFPIEDFENQTKYVVPSLLRRYHFKIIADNGTDKRSETGWEIHVSLQADNIPPKIINGVSVPKIDIRPGSVYVNDITQFLSDSSGINPEIKYVFVDFPTKLYSINWDDTSVINTGTIKNNKITFVSETGVTPYVCVLVKDTFGNITDGYIHFNITYWQRGITYEAKNTITTTLKFDEVYLNAGANLLYDTYSEDTGWNSTSKTLSYSSRQTSGGSIYTYYTDFTEAAFIRYNEYTKDYGSGGSNIFYYSDVHYFYPPAHFSNPIKCYLKDYILGNVGINILTDQPCLVHTLYCADDLGDNVQAWLNRGIEAKVQVASSMFTYVEPDDIPEGKYYRTLIHFADSDDDGIVMLPIKVK